MSVKQGRRFNTSSQVPFIDFGAPEELALDGSPKYMATETQESLLRVKHRRSLTYHPRSNLRAELGFKSINRLLRENVGSNDSLNTA